MSGEERVPTEELERFMYNFYGCYHKEDLVNALIKTLLRYNREGMEEWYDEDVIYPKSSIESEEK